MHHHNDWYAHVRILARYAGAWRSGPSPRLWGYLQHGWNVHDGFGANTPIVAGMPRFVWSDVARQRGWAVGETGIEVIGAPWAYLLRLEPETGVVPDAEREGTIFYPFHAWEKQSVIGDHAELADEILANEQGPITICLYWVEYRDRKIRSYYEERGFRVISHGYRGDRTKACSPNFLRNQLVELRRHRRMASNRLSTASFYAASVGCETGVYGDPMILDDNHPVYGSLARIEALWPQMHARSVPVEIGAATAFRELGQGHVVSPAELAEICGWARPDWTQSTGSIRQPEDSRT